jgi:hypothetical protein
MIAQIVNTAIAVGQEQQNQYNVHYVVVRFWIFHNATIISNCTKYNATSDVDYVGKD